MSENPLHYQHLGRIQGFLNALEAISSRTDHVSTFTFEQLTAAPATLIQKNNWKDFLHGELSQFFFVGFQKDQINQSGVRKAFISTVAEFLEPMGATVFVNSQKQTSDTFELELIFDCGKSGKFLLHVGNSD